MTDHVKYLPTGTAPGDAGTWSPHDAERWRAAGGSAVFAPGGGGWVLAALVAVTFALTPWPDGAPWSAYPMAVLTAALPLWYRYLPVPVLLCAVVVAADAVVLLGGAADGGVRLGLVSAFLAAVWAFTGALFRLRARRRQRAVAHAAAGSARHPLPDGIPDSHVRRGGRWIGLGGGLCLAAAALLAHGLVQDLTADGGPAAYEPIGQQVTALLLLVPGTTLVGRGLVTRWAARRLYDGPQPALIVGVRATASRHQWITPDARTPAARPLIAYFSWPPDTHRGRRLLRGGAEHTLRQEHHDIDPLEEPFEAVLYGTLAEGSEAVLQYAVYDGDTRIVDRIVTAPLLPRRRRRPGIWTSSGVSHRLTERRRVRTAAEAAAAKQRMAAARQKDRRPESTSSSGRNSAGTSCGGCGGGGCGGGGCGGCGCG